MPFSEVHQQENSLITFEYQAFLLRCWKESISGVGMESSWRFSLIHFDGIQREKGFASFEDLVKYLRAELAKRDNLETSS